MLLRPYACVLEGEIRWGVEVEVEDGLITRVGIQSGVPEDYVLCPAFVNAHSHMEYRGLMGRVGGDDFFAWIREITEQKSQQEADQVRKDCLTAAAENRATGVAYVWEHADRPGSAAAMRTAGLQGVVFQELITFNEHENPGEKWALVHERAAQQAKEGGFPTYVNPHALYTVDDASLHKIASRPGPISIHCAESRFERELTENGTGKFAEFQRAHGWNVVAQGLSPVAVVNGYGMLKSTTQLVHCCDVDESDIRRIAQARASVAHCPRSNQRLGCQTAPVRQMLDAGIRVGLGLDSAASSGPIDMFAEMRAALAASRRIGRPVTGEEVLGMATTQGAKSLGLGGWEIKEGSKVPLIKVGVDDCRSAEELLEHGSPQAVSWV